MRISGTEPSPVILSQTKKFQKVTSDALKCQNKIKRKRNEPTNYHFLIFCIITTLFG